MDRTVLRQQVEIGDGDGTRPVVVQGKEATLFDLRLFQALRDGPRTPAELARSLALRPERAPELLDALAAEGLIERRGDCYVNAEEIDELLEPPEPPATRPRLSWLLSPLLLLTVVALGSLFFLAQPHRPAAGAQPRSSRADTETSAPQSDPYEGYGDPVFYLVASPEQAELMRSGAFGGGIETTGGTVVVAGSAEEAVQARIAAPGTWTFDVLASPDAERAVRALLQTANRIRANTGQRTVQVIDLRPTFASADPQ